MHGHDQLRTSGDLSAGRHCRDRPLRGLAQSRRVRRPGRHPYGNLLAAKLLLVGVAALLGGFNRFFVMPPWLERESGGDAAPAALPPRFKHILWIEALVLLAVVVLAAWPTSTSPPGEQM
ncbi:CopD family protein [Telluria mixta]